MSSHTEQDELIEQLKNKIVKLEKENQYLRDKYTTLITQMSEKTRQLIANGRSHTLVLKD